FDMFFVVFGFTRLDSAARDAARAAGSTASAGQGLSAAQLAAKTYTTDGYFVTQPKVYPTGVAVANPGGTNPLAWNYIGTGAAAPGANTDFYYIQNPSWNVNTQAGSPYVVVTTRSNVSVPFGVNFFGASFGGGGAGGTIAYARTYTYPILG